MSNEPRDNTECQIKQADLPTSKEDFLGCGSHFPWIFGGIPGYDSLEAVKAVKMLTRHYILKTVCNKIPGFL